MLDQTTKRKLDSARQILVGKVPDPKAQVEQITTALIYKFMDDMDKENEEVGLKTQFFVDDWKKFSWTKILDSKLSGQDRLDLYVQAITNMPKNPHIPQLFRDIFKGAFLPYNDARTLSLFLKEINEFNYEHSENLGNAFEYLLSILGSQGDAGQFRTPRHIIDFIVDVVDPKKNETILDPACGTAGFLISAYKHILKQNKEKALTPDEKLKLMNNLAGYDISPDMVKLALVNMYLHGFPEPKIHEYDSLTSEKRWDENFDVILANPPFMTPKGGIVPHKKFSIQAKKAEILFVDYILEHLNINGKAGIIVPDGIIANSPNAYKKLRQKLVEHNFLYALVSVPAGIFLPYSDVKTTILFIDRDVAKKTKQILFVQVKNEGFDLGSTRRSITENDLPFAVKTINSFKNSVLSGKTFSVSNEDFDKANVEVKSEILASPSVSLSGKRYKKEVFIKSKYKSVKLGTLTSEFKQKVKDSIVPVWSVSNSQGFVVSSEYFGKQVASEDTKNYKKVLENYFAYNPARVNVGSVALNENNSVGCVSPMYVVFKIQDVNVIRPKYLLMLLKSKLGIKQILKYSDGAVRKILSYQNLSLIDIPLPSIKEQDKILEHFSAINDLRAKIIAEEIEIKKDVETCWGIKESEVIIEADEISTDTDDNDSDEA
ncbi:MAG: N-6 DNA methylase [bacterium]|nr:N-6 DNA methylase [bacterium]